MVWVNDIAEEDASNVLAPMMLFYLCYELFNITAMTNRYCF